MTEQLLEETDKQGVAADGQCFFWAQQKYSKAGCGDGCTTLTMPNTTELYNLHCELYGI